jgi:hypothetical protein
MNGTATISLSASEPIQAFFLLKLFPNYSKEESKSFYKSQRRFGVKVNQKPKVIAPASIFAPYTLRRSKMNRLIKNQ